MTEISVSRVLLCSLMLFGAGAGGCGNARFDSAGPSVRSFHDNGGIATQYVGIDLAFTVEQDDPHVPGLQRDTR